MPTPGLDPNAPLRIAYLTYRGKPHVGGQGVYTRHLTKALSDLGHTVEVFGGQPYPVLEQLVERRQCRSSAFGHGRNVASLGPGSQAPSTAGRGRSPLPEPQPEPEPRTRA